MSGRRGGRGMSGGMDTRVGFKSQRQNRPGASAELLFFIEVDFPTQPDRRPVRKRGIERYAVFPFALAWVGPKMSVNGAEITGKPPGRDLARVTVRRGGKRISHQEMLLIAADYLRTEKRRKAQTALTMARLDGDLRAIGGES